MSAELIQRVVEMTAGACGVAVEDVLSRSHRPAPSMARHVAMHLLSLVGKMRVKEIGAAFNRDYSTVVYAVSKVYRLRTTDPTSRAWFDEQERNVERLLAGLEPGNNGACPSCGRPYEPPGRVERLP